MKKDFTDFLETLTPEIFENIADKINSNSYQFEFSLSPDGFKGLFNAVAISDINITLELLKLYHEWLNS